MRFRKRLSAAILAIVMMVSSIQIPGGTSYAAEIAGSSIEGVQDAQIPAVEETEEDSGIAGSESQPDEEDAELDDGNLADDDSKTGDGNPAGDDSQTNDDNLTGDDSGTDDENDPDAGQVSGDDAEEPVLSVDTEETGTKETEVVEAEIEGAYQFGDAPSAHGGISVFSVSTYDNSVEDYVYEQMLEHEETIDISSYGITLETAKKLGAGVLNEHPDLYFVNRRISYSYGADEVVRMLIVSYDTSYDDAAFRENTEAALACVTDEMSDDAKAAALHEYLAINVEYDYDNFKADSVPEESYNAYGALVNGIAVCNGYALAYKYLLNQVGIECYMVTSESMDHAWNMVKLDGEYYHVDVTWDDPVRDMVGRVFHENLFRSDTNFGAHKEWVVTSGSDTVDYEATDAKYESAFWVNFDVPLVFYGSDCYYITKGTLNKGDFSSITGTETKVTDIGTHWKMWYGNIDFDINGATYSGLYMIKDRLFYNDWDSIYSIKPDGTGKKTEFTPQKADREQIYYSAYRRGQVVYALQSSSESPSSKQNVLVAEINLGGNETEPPETKEGYNVDNLTDTAFAEYEFTNVLDSNGKTTPKADGKPVVLMFYNSSSTGTDGVSTFKDIVDHAGYFKTDADSVDFYEFDIKFGKTEESIKNFAVSNGLSGTNVFNWIYVPNAEPLKNHYYDQFKEQSSVTGDTYPLLVYIDKDNKIQYATEGNLTAEEILVNLRQYCGYTQYYINYEMDGGDNNESNPAMYTGGKEVVLKNPPYREGYRFDGWYEDEQYTNKVTKIPGESRKDVTLYAKWVKGAYDLANLKQEYTTVDDTKVSSTADSKPKLLIFFRMDQQEGLFTSTLESISGELKEPEDPGRALEGVDIYAIDIGNATKSQLKEFSGKYAEGITFCYDTNGLYKEYMDAYMNAAGFDTDYYKSSFAVRDFKCYIDKDDRLQYVDPDYGHCFIVDIMEALKEYCKYPSYVTYKIQYELNGGTNNINNPSTYNNEMETITLEAPTKNSYIFGGWYSDEQLTKKVTHIRKGSTGDITLYAKWKWKLNAENPEYEYHVAGGRTLSSAADGKPKVLLFHSIENSSLSHKMYQVFSEHIKDYDGVDICAIGNYSDENEVIAYKKQYGCDGITYCYDTYFQFNGQDISHNASQMTKYVKILDPYSKSATYPVIVYIDAENYVQHVVEKADQSWTEILEDLRDYCGYERYIINYELDGGKNNSENPYTFTEDTETIVLKNPSKGTHRFDGWYTDPEYAPEQKVTQIPKGSSKDITLYAKWTKTGAGLGLDNLEYTFTAVDDTTFSSAAENGRPRILIFFSASCLNSAFTMENIKNAKEELEGIDIYTIECTKQSKDTVTQIQEACEFEKGTVSYSTGTSNSNAMYAYLVKAQIKERPVQFPIICYIDANNYLEWVTMDKETATADSLLANLKTYCNYPPDPEGVYNITYELDGGTNHEDNPDTYTAETETIVLKDASKTRFLFEGWYEDAEFTKPIKEITQGRTGDITLYAKWSADEDGALGIDNLKQTYKGLDGKALSSGADDKPKLLVFFMTDDTGSQNTINNITGSIDSLDGVDIYAIEMGQATSGQVATFKNTYGCDEITFAYDDWSSPSNYDKAAAYGDIAGLSGMNIPLICYIDKDNKLQWVSENEKTGDEVLENLKKYCNYPSQGQETYQITYVLDGGTNSSSNPTTYTSGTETITLEDAVKKGYIFEGWYEDAEFTVKVEQIVNGRTGDITLYAKWKEKGSDLGNPAVEFTTVDDKTVSSTADGKPKLILFYGNNDNYSTYTIGEIARKLPYSKELKAVDIYAVEVNQGTKDSVLEVKSSWGYSLDDITYSYDTGDSNKNSMLEYAKAAELDSVDKLPMLCYIDAANRLRYVSLGWATADEIVSNINIYCDTSDLEQETYTITYELDGGTNSSENPVTYTFKTETIILKDAVKEGYTFEGWYKDAEFTESGKVTEIVTGSTGNITLYAKWVKASSEQKTYQITYELDGGTNDIDNPDTYTSETDTIVLKDAVKEGYVFGGWYKDNKFLEQVTKIEQGSVGDITLYAKWKAKGYGENLDQTYTALDGTELSSIADGKPKVLVFFIYNSARSACKNTMNDIRDNIGELEGVDIYAIECNKGTKDKVSEFQDTYGTDKIPFAYDTTGTVNKPGMQAYELLATGKNVTTYTYPLICYIDADNNFQLLTTGESSTEDILENLQKYCGFVSQKDVYSITYVLNGGTNNSANPAVYTSDTETITLKDPIKEGSTFEGWYKDAGFTESEKVTEIAKGNKGDITLYAKWKAATIDTEEIKSGLYIRFMDYYELDADSSKPCYKYTGAAIKPDVEVYNNGTLLTLGTDYTLTYKNNTKVGAASLSVKGKGSFSGASDAVGFTIVKADIDTDTDHPEEMTVIAGTKVAPVIMNGNKNLTAKDYQLEGAGLENGKYAQATGASPNTLTVTGTGSYEGSFTIDVNVIAKGDAKKLAVTVDKNFKPVYDGSTLDLDALFASPYSNGGSITVTDSKDKTQVLEKGRDFSVVCKSGLKDAGTVKFTVTGMGAYAGSVSKTFKISPLKVTESGKFEVTFDDTKEYEYKASGTTVEGLTVKYLGDTASAYDDIELTEGRDYKVSYSNNKNVSTAKNAQVKIAFLGNYKGSVAVSKYFKIVAARMRDDGEGHNTDVVVPDKVYGKAGKAYKSVPIVTVDGETIKASNYTVSYAWATETDADNEESYLSDPNVKVTLGDNDSYAKVKVTITPKGASYALADGVTAIEGEYYVRRKAESAVDLSKAKVAFSDKGGNPLKALEYNGKAYYTPIGNDPADGNALDDPNAVYVSVTVNGVTVDRSLYDVVWTNSTAKGKATVVVTGKGNLAVGSKNQAISIKAMALKGKTFKTFIGNTANSLKNMFFKK